MPDEPESSIREDMIRPLAMMNNFACRPDQSPGAEYCQREEAQADEERHKSCDKCRAMKEK